MKKLLAFFLTALMLMSTVAMFAVSAYAPISVAAEEEAYVVEESETTISIPFWIHGLTDDHDLGSFDISVHFEDEALVNLGTIHSIRRPKTEYGASFFADEGGHQAGAPGVNPAKSLAWTTSDYNPEYIAYYELDTLPLFVVDFEFVEGWTGITELTVEFVDLLQRGTLAHLPHESTTFTIQRGDAAPAVENTLFVSGAADVSINGSITSVTEETGFAPAANDAIVLSATGENFLYWENVATGNVFSYDASVSFLAATELLKLKAVYGDAEVETVNVTFKDVLTGKIHAIQEVAVGTALDKADFPAHTPILGYAAHTYSVASGESFVEADGYVVEADTTVLLSYTKDNTALFTLTVDNGFKTIDYSRSFGAIATVYANVENFSYWADTNGNVLSLDPVFKFIMPNNDVTLTAVAGVVAPEAVLAIVENELSNGSIVTTIARDLADGFELVEAGILYTRKGIEADLVVPKASAYVTQGISTAADPVFGFVKNVAGKDGTWLVRGYMTYTDGTNNYTVYTAVESIVVA